MIFKVLSVFKSKKVIIPIIIALIVGVAWWRFEDALKETGRQAQVIVQQMQAIEELVEQVEDLERQRELEIQMFEDYIQESREITREHRELQEEFRELKNEMEDVGDWADKRKPDAVIDWMQQEPGTESNNKN